ncbi:gamma-butyrobetaine dioxygenase-like [Anneissia japonica]|uniref:gamma-butyrobetaine dioxygenase-like n=1 Tax=Anneissia japonica TaxID=1529436 RepID=UPI00142571C7|nr:gamma-butyrobetaine dioxygenase-like [Anneissia japonica]
MCTARNRLIAGAVFFSPDFHGSSKTMLRALSRINLRSLLTASAAVSSAGNLQSTCHSRFQNVLTTRRFKSHETYKPFKYHSNTFHIDKISGVIDIKFNKECSSRYPFIWLRDNCQCLMCHDKSSMQRRILLDTLDIDVEPENVLTDSVGQAMTVHWSDGHISEYPISWLKNYTFPQVVDHIQEMELRHWGSEVKLQTFSFVDILNDDSVLYNWLVCLHTDGLCKINDIGLEERNCMRLAERVAYPKPTCYGIDWALKSNPNPSNLAFSGVRLCLHTDLPYYAYEPGALIFHSIKVSEFGGVSEFVDSFKVSYDLKRNDPETFEILTRVPIGYADQGVDELSHSEYYLKDSKPIISGLISIQSKILVGAMRSTKRPGSKREIKKITFNQQARGIRIGVSVDDIKSVYKAMKVFHSALNNKENFVSFKIQPGEAVCFDNYRVMHGRQEFTVPAGNSTSRHLHGIFIDWDNIYSRIRVIAKNKNIFF